VPTGIWTARRRTRRRWRRRRREKKKALIKSNNPHLAGGEKRFKHIGKMDTIVDPPHNKHTLFRINLILKEYFFKRNYIYIYLKNI
jgi:hypothetical protein